MTDSAAYTALLAALSALGGGCGCDGDGGGGSDGCGGQVLVCAHTRPDGDAIGSVLAMVAALRVRGVDAVPLLADNALPPAPYNWMEGIADFVRPDEYEGLGAGSAADSAVAPAADVFIALDTPDVARLGAARELMEATANSGGRTIFIDHHPPVDESYAQVCYSDPQAAATGQIVWQVLGDLGWVRDAQVATACYVSVMSDTGSFQFSNTTKQTFFVASEMVEAGADPARIAALLFNQKPLAALRLEGRILSRTRLLNDGAVAHSYLSDADLQELGVASDWTENLIDLIRSMQDTTVALFITHTSKGPRVSLRGAGGFDVASVARRFGGGGHKVAAGIAWPDKSASREEILAALLPLLPGEHNGTP